MDNTFLKIRNFKIKINNIEFSDVEYMSAAEKTQIYKNFVTFLNNHFKESSFKKNLYEHLHLHCGFIAHYNIKGFYSEYFTTAARFQKIALDFTSKPSEYGSFINDSYRGKDSLLAKQAFYKIYEELNGNRVGLGEFYEVIKSKGRFSYSGDYDDLNKAMAEVFYEYMDSWRDLIRSSIQEKYKLERNTLKVKVDKEVEVITILDNKFGTASDDDFKQTSIFDFI